MLLLALRAGWRGNAKGHGATGLLWAGRLMSCEKRAHLEPDKLRVTWQ